MSYSSFTQWLKCGKQYQMTRLLGIREVPAWYHAGGGAVHSATEAYDRLRWEEGLA